MNLSRSAYIIGLKAASLLRNARILSFDAAAYAMSLAKQLRRRVPLKEMIAITSDMSKRSRDYLHAVAPDYPDWVKRRLGLIKGLFTGTVIGAGAGALLGGGGVGVVALGGAIGLPLIAITAVVGALLGTLAGNELDWLRYQWEGAAKRKELASEQNLALDQSPEMQPQIWVRLSDREHLQYLREAIGRAESNLTIRSAFLSDYVVDNRFVRELSEALSRGVHVNIEYGYVFPWETRTRRLSRERAEERLRQIYSEALYRGKGQLHVARTPTHIKELALDDKEAVIGSHNWLSNASVRNKEKSIVLHNEEVARQIRLEAQDAIKTFIKP